MFVGGPEEERTTPTLQQNQRRSEVAVKPAFRTIGGLSVRFCRKALLKVRKECAGDKHEPYHSTLSSYWRGARLNRRRTDHRSNSPIQACLRSAARSAADRRSRSGSAGGCSDLWRMDWHARWLHQCRRQGTGHRLPAEAGISRGYVRQARPALVSDRPTAFPGRV